MLGKDAWSVSWTSPGGCGISALAVVRRSWRTGRHVEGDDREEGWKQDSMRGVVPGRYPGQRDVQVGRKGTSLRTESLRGDRVNLVGTEDGSEA